MLTSFRFVIALWLVVVMPVLAAAEPAQELLSHGDFNVDSSGNGAPDGWSLPAAASWGRDGFLRLQAAGPNASVSVHRIVELQGARALRLAFRVRHENVKRGPEAWHDARILLDFKDADGKNVRPSPAHPYVTGTSSGWVEREMFFRVPESAVRLAIMPGLYHAVSGTVDFDDISLTAIDPSAIPERTRSPEPVVDAGKAHPLMLRTVGNQVLDSADNVVWLQGVNVPSLEWSNTGERVLASIVEAIGNWQANVIRVPVKSERWFGRDKAQNDGGAAYRALLDQVVLACASRGAYVIIDLHHYRAASAKEVEFWTSAAAHFKDHPAVLFGLLNEPHDISWDIWKDGGEVTRRRRNTDAVAENAQEIESFTAVGFQELVHVVRATGAKNVLLIGGLDWAYDLSGITNGFALVDPDGNGIIYDSHVYPWKSGWQRRFLDCAAVHPVLLGEVGCDIARMDFIPADRHEDPYTWAPDMLACIQKNRLHWTAWSFHAGATPRILADHHSYTPTPYWGAFVMAALKGATFTSDRLR